MAQADSQSIRLYSMSAAILDQRTSYYQVLEQTQRGGMDVTPWVVWFLEILESTLQTALDKIDRTLAKTRFWRQLHDAGLLAEQVKVINRLLEGGEQNFEHGISASQYKSVAKVSKATATRHLADLLDKGWAKNCPVGGGVRGIE